jgi:hypothetical protein
VLVRSRDAHSIADGQLGIAEDRNPWHEQVFEKRKVEAALDVKLFAVGADHFAFATTE